MTQLFTIVRLFKSMQIDERCAFNLYEYNVQCEIFTNTCILSIYN